MDLRIYFMGLLTFVQSESGEEIVVLMVNALDESLASDGARIAPHVPLLLARSSSCRGDCGISDPTIAEFVFPDVGSGAALDSLASALNGGAAWRLANSELSLAMGSDGVLSSSRLEIRRQLGREVVDQPGYLPRSATERSDFIWVASLSRLYPGAALDPDVLATEPKKERIVGRLRLRNGTVSTYRMLRINGEVRPIAFRTLVNGTQSEYAQALADWVVAEIQVPGNEVRIIEQGFDGVSRREVTLSGDGGAVEVALLNVPEGYFDLSATPRPAIPNPGKHFERFYDLFETPPPTHLRPVPHATTETGIDWASVHPSEQLVSDLLDGIRLTTPKGAYDRVLCPGTQLP